RYFLSHLVCPMSAFNVKCLRYLLEAELIKPKEHEQVMQTALNTAMLHQNTQAVKMLMGAKFQNEKDKMMRDYAMSQMKQRNKCEDLFAYLKRETTETELKKIESLLVKVMLALIKDGRFLSSDVFNLCCLFDETTMWNAMYAKCKELLNGNTLYQNHNDWKWIEEHILENRDLLIWLKEGMEKMKMNH
ncbi:hypothetical protein RFI_20123, partial [Reticulomyxa filosa]